MERIGLKIHELVGTVHNNRSGNKTSGPGPPSHNETVLIGKLQEWILETPEALLFQDSQHRTALHIACAFQSPLSIIRFLIHQELLLLEKLNSRNKLQLPSIHSRTTKGLLPIHYACREQASLQVIQCLVNSAISSFGTTNNNEAADQQSSSGGLSVTTNDGWLPLHMACARKAKTPVINFLLQKYPRAAHLSTHCGRYALHFACANRLEVSAVRAVYLASPSVLQRHDKSEWNPLHVACAYSTLEVVAYLVDECWLDGLKVRGGGQDVQRLPLHLACSERQPLEIVVHLVLAYRAALHEADANRLLPIHAACKGGAPVEVVQFLISEWPPSAFRLGSTVEDIIAYIQQRQKQILSSKDRNIQSLKLQSWLERVVKDHEKDTPPSGVYVPLSAGIGNHPPPFPNPIKNRISDGTITSTSSRNTRRSTSNSFDSSDDNNEFRMGFEAPPLGQINHQVNHTARRISSSGSRSSTSSNSSSARGTGVPDDRNFRSAGERLHQSCEMPQNLAAIQKILNEHPETIDYASYGLLPIHTACLNQAPVNVLTLLDQFAQDAIRKRDGEGNLPLHLACYSSAPLDSIECLLKRWPEAVKMLNANGETPLYRATHPFYDNPNAEIIGLLQGYEIQVDLNQQEQQSHHHGMTRKLISLSNDELPSAQSQKQEPLLSPTGRNQQRKAPGFNPAISPPKVFQAPMGVDDVRAVLDGIRATKVSTRNLDVNDGGGDTIRGQQPLDAAPSKGATAPPLSQTSPRQYRRTHSGDSSGSLGAPPTSGLQRATNLRGIKIQSAETQLGETNSSTRITSAAATTAQPGVGLQQATPLRGTSGPSPPESEAVDASNSTDPFAKAQRPGVVMVNEPGMNPDSAMFRAAYGDRGSQPSSGQAFGAPPGVQEVRGLVDALRQSQQTSRWSMEQISQDLQQYDSGDDVGGQETIAPNPGSSFYQAALQESSQTRHSIPETFASASTMPSIGVPQEEVGSSPAIASSFYRAALAATSDSKLPASPDMSNPSSFYRAAMAEASISSPSSGRSDSFQLLISSGGGGQHPASSFYMEAMEASGVLGRDQRGNVRNHATSASRPGAVTLNEIGMNPSTAMYRAAYGSDEQQRAAATRPGIVMVDEPGMNPSSAMYQAAYGNANSARPQHHQGS